MYEPAAVLNTTSAKWEDTFRRWAKPPGKSERERCDNAVRMVRTAIAQHPALESRTIEVFPQGSYRNNTNVRRDSDVDVCVRCMAPFFPDLPEGLARSDVDIVDSDYTYGQFKNEVGAALRAYFGDGAVDRGNKAFDVHANTYRVDADVVPTFEHRRYLRGSSGPYYLSGAELWPDTGARIVNWPNQNYENGTNKNEATGRRFKKAVRILKSLCNRMSDEGITEARDVPSYLLECLVWNVPNELFVSDAYSEMMRENLLYLFKQTQTEAGCQEWGEVNELKYLFRSRQPWTREQANGFILAAWAYLGLE